MKKMTKRLACLVLVLVMACCALPGVTYGATTSVNLNQNYLFRTRTNAFSFGAGETANLTFTPQYTAEYTLKLYGHVTGGRNIRASLTDPDGTVTDFEYPNRTGSIVKDYSHPYLTATLEQGKTYTYSVWGKQYRRNGRRGLYQRRKRYPFQGGRAAAVSGPNGIYCLQPTGGAECNEAADCGSHRRPLGMEV